MGEELNLTLPMGMPGTLPDEEQAALRMGLWRFLGKRTERYTTGDSSSVTVETAQELLTSICFTLDAALKSPGAASKLLVTENLDVLFENGLRVLEAKITEGRRLWQIACIGAPEIENIAFRDTLRGIGGFWKRYDYRFFAHQIPCFIDYPPCHPVPDDCGGVDYVNEYLRRIILENGILRLFERDLEIRLLERYCPDYKGLLINLCEPVIVNAVGCSLIGSLPLSLQISGADQLRLAALFEPLSKTAAHSALSGAARRFCRAAGITDAFAAAYVTSTATDLYPRISAALPSGNLAGIFLPLD